MLMLVRFLICDYLTGPAKTTIKVLGDREHFQPAMTLAYLSKVIYDYGGLEPYQILQSQHVEAEGEVIRIERIYREQLSWQLGLHQFINKQSCIIKGQTYSITLCTPDNAGQFAKHCWRHTMLVTRSKLLSKQQAQQT